MKSIEEQFADIERDIQQTAFDSFVKEAEDKLKTINSGQSISVSLDTDFGIFSMDNVSLYFRRKNYIVERESSLKVIITKP